MLIDYSYFSSFSLLFLIICFCFIPEISLLFCHALKICKSTVMLLKCLLQFVFIGLGKTFCVSQVCYLHSIQVRNPCLYFQLHFLTIPFFYLVFQDKITWQFNMWTHILIPRNVLLALVYLYILSCQSITVSLKLSQSYSYLINITDFCASI